MLASFFGTLLYLSFIHSFYAMDLPRLIQILYRLRGLENFWKDLAELQDVSAFQETSPSLLVRRKEWSISSTSGIVWTIFRWMLGAIAASSNHFVYEQFHRMIMDD